MKFFLFSFLIVFIGFIAYRVIAIIYYFSVLRLRLLGQNLEFFKQILGVGYQFRYTADGIRRYKWPKGWYVIRASFDEAGNLIASKKREINLFRLIAEFTIPAPKKAIFNEVKEQIA